MLPSYQGQCGTCWANKWAPDPRWCIQREQLRIDVRRRTNVEVMMLEGPAGAPAEMSTTDSRRSCPAPSCFQRLLATTPVLQHSQRAKKQLAFGAEGCR